MTTIDDAKNMRSGINVEGTVERKEEVFCLNVRITIVGQFSIETKHFKRMVAPGTKRVAGCVATSRDRPRPNPSRTPLTSPLLL